jgi:MFS family permease
MTRFTRDYWKLWTASVTSNFGDGVASVAYPWLASAITRDGFQLSLVVLATRLPWLVFSLPAGVITDRADRRVLMVTMDAVRCVLTAGVAIVVLLSGPALESPGDPAAAGPGDASLLLMLVAAAFLLGMAEVLRDNAAQTILPALVPKESLERANGNMWGAETVMNSFAGPPAAGILIGISLSLPFFVDAGSFAVAAALVFLIGGSFRSQGEPLGPGGSPSGPSFRQQISEGFGWLWRHPLFRPLALVLGAINGLTTMALATYVLFVQEILGLEATSFGLLLTAGAAGAVVGSVAAARVAERIGKGPSLFITLLGSMVGVAITGLTSSALVVWVVFVVQAFLATLWNVITVSLRQRVIPDRLLGRVNSVYRFFGWGMMSVGALLGGAVVSVAQPLVGREWALRLPFLLAAAAYLAVFVYALPRLNSARIAETDASIAGAGA